MEKLINQFCKLKTKELFESLDFQVRKHFVFFSVQCIDDKKGDIVLAKKILSFFGTNDEDNQDGGDDKKINELDEETLDIPEKPKSLILILKDLKSFKIDDKSYFESGFLKYLLELPNNGYVILNYESKEFEQLVVSEKLDPTFLMETIGDEKDIEKILNFLDYFQVNKEKSLQFVNIIMRIMGKHYSLEVEYYLTKHIKIKKNYTDHPLLSNPNISEKFCLKNAVDFTQIARNDGLSEIFFKKHLKEFTRVRKALYFLCQNKALSDQFFIDNKSTFDTRCKLYVGEGIDFHTLDNQTIKFTDVILSNPNISELYLRNFAADGGTPDGWFFISKRKDLSEQFIVEFLEFLNPQLLFQTGSSITPLIFNLLLPSINNIGHHVQTLLEKSKISTDFFSAHMALFTTHHSLGACFRFMGKNRNLTPIHVVSLTQFFIKFAREEICSNPSVPLAFFENNFQFLSPEALNILSSNPVLTDKFVKKHFNKLSKIDLCTNPSLTEEFFTEYEYKLNIDIKSVISGAMWRSDEYGRNEIGLPLSMMEKYIKDPKDWEKLFRSLFRSKRVGLDYIKDQYLAKKLKMILK